MLPIDMVYAAATRSPEAIAVETDAENISYREMVVRVDALAAGLQSIDPAAQSRVGICGYNSLEHLIGLLAVMAAGKIWVPLNPRDGAEDLGHKVETANPTIVIVDDDCEALLAGGTATRLIGLGGSVGASDSVAGLLARHQGKTPIRPVLTPEDVQAIKFTGGSSGRPKGVLQPYRAWNTGAISMIHELGLTAKDRYLLCSPLTHGTSCYVTPVLGIGGTLVLGDRSMRPGAILDAFAGRGITTTFITPTVIYMMLAELGNQPVSFPDLRRLIYGGAPMPPGKIRAVQDVFGPVTATNYGQTEAPQIITYLSPADMMDDANIESVGRASVLTRIAILDPDGDDPRPSGEMGEIVVSGGLVMKGYLDMPEATAEVMRGGWLRTGDAGVIDERGYLFIKDRLRDVIITGGFNVYPTDVEAALVRHPAIHECVVYGLPDEKWGEAVRATVVLRAGATASDQELIDFTKEKLGSVRAPKAVRFVDDLPRSGVGKVIRRQVRDEDATLMEHDNK
jgi:acyl-CoA synthetase (AMP-forming)/AMP-acid ligase II